MGEVWRSESLCEKRGRENPWSVPCLALRSYKHCLPIHLPSSDNVLSWSHLAEGFRGLVFSKCSVAALGCQALFLTRWRAQLGYFPRRSSALQDLQSASWQICALIVVPHPFCSGFPFFTKANTLQDCTKASHFLWRALAFAVVLPKCAAGLRATGDTFRAYGKEVLTFRGFQERMLGNTGQLSRLWFTADCLVSELSSGSWLCLLGEPLLNNNSCYISLSK